MSVRDDYEKAATRALTAEAKLAEATERAQELTQLNCKLEDEVSRWIRERNSKECDRAIADGLLTGLKRAAWKVMNAWSPLKHPEMKAAMNELGEQLQECDASEAADRERLGWPARQDERPAWRQEIHDNFERSNADPRPAIVAPTAQVRQGPQEIKCRSCECILSIQDVCNDCLEESSNGEKV